MISKNVALRGRVAVNLGNRTDCALINVLNQCQLCTGDEMLQDSIANDPIALTPIHRTSPSFNGWRDLLVLLLAV